jgi:hypothetical protein
LVDLRTTFALPLPLAGCAGVPVGVGAPGVLGVAGVPGELGELAGVPGAPGLFVEPLEAGE